MATFGDFIGSWQLDPAQNNFLTTEAPVSGKVKVLVADDVKLKFEVSWIDATGNTLDFSTEAIVDGEQYPYANPAVASYVKSDFINENSIQTDTVKDDKVISRESRTLQAEGQELKITQQYFLADGLSFTNAAVYKKNAPDQED